MSRVWIVGLNEQSHPPRGSAGPVLPLLCPACGGEMRIILFITVPGTNRSHGEVLRHGLAALGTVLPVAARRSQVGSSLDLRFGICRS